MVAISETARPRSSRIPTSLQAVFIAANRGKDINQPPPESMGAKVFLRNWLPPSRSSNASSNNSVSKNGAKSSKYGSTSVPKTISVVPRTDLSPEAYLDVLIRSRGYSIERYQTLKGAYHNKPTALQQASYDINLKDLIRKGDLETFEGILAAKISPNPCNSFGESIVHMVCRRGDTEFLKLLVKYGCCLQVSDDYGRTPLHDACWSSKPNFEIVDIILRSDRRMVHLTDARGFAPLSYVRKDHWSNWLEFLERKKDVYWPRRNSRFVGEEEQPELTVYAPNTRPLLNPPGCLPCKVANMVASGRVKPDEVHHIMYEKEDSNRTRMTDQTEADDSDTDSEYDSDDYSDDNSSDDDSSFDDEEMDEILHSMTLSPSAYY